MHMQMRVLTTTSCAIVSQESSSVLSTVFEVLDVLDVQVEMISQGASKVNISLVVKGEHEKKAIQALHSCFFEGQCIVPM